jgi:hypothetical protein
MFGDDTKINPTLAVDEIASANVVDVLPPLGAVMRSLVVQPDLRLVVAHVDERSRGPVGHLDLGSRRWQTVIDENEAQPGLPG